MLLQTIEDTWFQFIKNSIDGGVIPESKIMIELQNGLRPTPPYISFSINTISQNIGMDETRLINSSSSKQHGLRRGVISIKGHGYEASDQLSAIMSAFDGEEFNALKQGGISITNKGQIILVPSITRLDTIIEKRYVMDVAFRYVYSRDINVGAVTGVSISGEVVKEDETPKVVEEFVVGQTP